MIERAKRIVLDYIQQHCEPNPDAQPALFVVWQAAVLQNFKCLISVTLPRGMYFELTYDGDRRVWYFDAYGKLENQEVRDA